MAKGCRDKISSEHGLSGGAVTNIVNELRQAIDFPVADELRELAVILSRLVSRLVNVPLAVGFQ